jgi:uncharacterized protein with GYD domain
MAKYLVKASYSAEGTRGLLKDGGSGRHEAVEGLINSLGGTLESFYYAFGDEDLYWICDMPGHAELVAMSLAINAARGARVSTVPLLSLDEVDSAIHKATIYRPPGT